MSEGTRKRAEGRQHDPLPATKRVEADESPAVDSLRWLQRTAGNAAVAELLDGGKERYDPSRPADAGVGWMGRAGSVKNVFPTGGAAPTAQRQGGGGAAKKVAHATGKEVDGYLIASTFLKPYVEPKMKGGTKAETAVNIHSAADFKKEWIAYALARTNPDTKKTFTKAEAEAWESKVNAFQGDDKIHVHEGRGEKATTIHESMHLFADEAFVNAVGFNVNEGTTEYFTKVVTGEQKITRGTFYPDQHKSVSKLIGVSSKTKLADAYFTNKMDDLKKDADAKGKGTWDKWLGFVKGGKYSDADALLK